MIMDMRSFPSLADVREAEAILDDYGETPPTTQSDDLREEAIHEQEDDNDSIPTPR